jgi:hypothetical protein
MTIEAVSHFVNMSARPVSLEAEFRKYLPDLSTPRFVAMRQQDSREYAKEFQTKGNPPWLYALTQHWLDLAQEPFKGITKDGRIQPDLFALVDEEVPIETIVSATDDLLALLSQPERDRTLFHIDSPEWRTWSNPEFLLNDKGIRLEDCTPNVRDGVMNVLRSSLSTEGFQKAVSAMLINGFLGKLVDAESVLNEFSYNFAIFGRPSTTKPWGFSFYGHHLCLNIFFYRSQIVISPCFTGAEPNEIDTGPHAGTEILKREDELGLKLMQSLPTALQERAQIYRMLKDPAMPPGRWNRDDQRHLCGAFRDNRVIPYEGIPVSDMDAEQHNLVEKILEGFLLYLPSRAREIRLAHVRQHFDETYFCWIGDFGEGDAFYYRIQSPVIIVEFDHHSGVFLCNAEPARFHTHTLLRTPNAGDYGKALLPLTAGEEQAFIFNHGDGLGSKAQVEGYQKE